MSGGLSCAASRTFCLYTAYVRGLQKIMFTSREQRQSLHTRPASHSLQVCGFLVWASLGLLVIRITGKESWKSVQDSFLCLCYSEGKFKMTVIPFRLF
ncbi:hypothetical protein EUGRSUZ_K03132 [Eucalyptus grandis]|uniref:Uncharacterized protein n=2 Tax=Eucalyptus grandis TaxID=71139 RepID=A0ACC3IYX5_EUCGR|nr:hypothetical protein EUGRSUZ_K03132 [Eucalyptus grandis]